MEQNSLTPDGIEPGVGPAPVAAAFNRSSQSLIDCL